LLAELPIGKASPSLLNVEKGKWLYQIGGNFGDDSIFRLELDYPFEKWQEIRPVEGSPLLGCG
jgi:hypothetical protein